MGNVFNFSVRFDLENEQDALAYQFLKERDKKKFHSYSQLVSVAICELFSDSATGEPVFSETLRKIIQEELEKVKFSTVSPEGKEAEVLSEDDIANALNFIDSF